PRRGRIDGVIAKDPDPEDREHQDRRQDQSHPQIGEVAPRHLRLSLGQWARFSRTRQRRCRERSNDVGTGQLAPATLRWPWWALVHARAIVADKWTRWLAGGVASWRVG